MRGCRDAGAAVKTSGVGMVVDVGRDADEARGCSVVAGVAVKASDVVGKTVVCKTGTVVEADCVGSGVGVVNVDDVASGTGVADDAWGKRGSNTRIISLLHEKR